MQLVLDIVIQIASVLYEGAFYLLLGFLIAGALHVFVPTHSIARFLGARSPRSVALAALFGAPVPLCSCGVLPASAALKDKGASKPALLSFLISTPETGVDSIALTYALLGPVMAVVRPIVALVTAIVAGLAALVAEPASEPVGAGDRAATASEVDASCCAPASLPAATPAATAERDAPTAEGGAPAARDGWTTVRAALRYGFVTMLDEIAFWLILGLVLTGLLAALLPDQLMQGTIGVTHGLVAMGAMLLAGTPLYVCASASTPVAAALVAKGLPPGAALVFLLVGPATNAASITVVARLLGRRYVRIYLLSILGVSVLGGMALDRFAADAIRLRAVAGLTEDALPMAILKVIAAVAFIGLLLASYRRTGFREGIADTRSQWRRLVAWVRSIEPRRLLSWRLLLGATAILGVLVVPQMMLEVQPGEVGIIQTLGRVTRGDAPPGLHWHWPAPFGRGSVVAVDRVRQVPIGTATAGERRDARDYFVTADENLIDIQGIVEYGVADPVRFALGAEESGAAIADLARNELLRIVGQLPIDRIYTIDRRQVQETLRQRVAARLATLELGCRLIDVKLLSVHAPSNVHDAFRDVASALEDKQRSVHEADRYAAETLGRASGQSASLTARALADGVRRRQAAGAESEAFLGLAAAHQRSPGVTEQRLYLETMERALDGPRTFIHMADDARGDVDLWINGEPTTVPGEPVPAPQAESGAGGGDDDR